jgi:hypothetical protein
MFISWVVKQCAVVGRYQPFRNVYWAPMSQLDDAVRFSETLVSTCTCTCTWRYNLEDQHHHLHSRDNLKFRSFLEHVTVSTFHESPFLYQITDRGEGTEGRRINGGIKKSAEGRMTGKLMEPGRVGSSGGGGGWQANYVEKIPQY